MGLLHGFAFRPYLRLSLSAICYDSAQDHLLESDVRALLAAANSYPSLLAENARLKEALRQMTAVVEDAHCEYDLLVPGGFKRSDVEAELSRARALLSESPK